MLPRKLTLEGFLSFRYKTTFEFDGLDFTVLTGENGSGKSSMILGISWALFGESRVGSDKDSVVNDYEEEASAELDLEDSSGTLWRIRRVRYWRGSSELMVAHYDEETSEWVTFGDHRIETSQNKIYEIIGLDEDAYHSLMVMKQNSMAGGNRFTAANSNQRRAILMGLLPELDIWGNYEASASDMLYDTNQSINSLESGLESDRETLTSTSETASKLVESIYDDIFDEDSPEIESDDSLDHAIEATFKLIAKSHIEKDIKTLEEKAESYRSTIANSSDGRGDLESQLKTIRAERRAHNAEVESEERELKSQLNQLDKMKRSVDRLQIKIERTTSSIKSIEKDIEELPKHIAETTSEMAEFQEDHKRLVKAADEKKGQLDSLIAEQGEVERQIEALTLQVENDEGAECIVCQSPLAHDKAEDILSHSQEKLDDLEEQVAQARKAHRRASKKMKDIESDIKDMDREVRDMKSDLRESESELKSLNTQLDEQEAELKELEKDIKKVGSRKDIQSQIDKLEYWEESEEEQKLQEQIEDLDEEHPLKPELDKIVDKIDTLRDDLSKLNRLHGRLESESDRIISLREEIQEAEKELTKLKEYRSYLEWVKHGCSPKGVPAMLISEVLEDIEDRQNQLLERLMGNRAMRVRFSQERKLKSREGSQSVLDIIVETPDGWERPIESFSGGEQIRLTFSNLFAMLQVFNERHPGMVETLFLDEPLGAIDRESVPVMVDIIRDALEQRIVRSVFIVSHEQMVVDAIPQRMEFFRDPTMDNASNYEVLT